MGRRGLAGAKKAQLDPQSFWGRLEQHLDWMRVKNYSPLTVEKRRTCLGAFIRWCEDRGVLRPSEVTRPMLERYQRFLYYHRKHDGKPLTFGTQLAHLVPIRTFFKWLARENVVLYNPAADLEMPRREHRLPKHVLSPEEAERVMAQPDPTTVLGLRDRAMLETLYSTGIRRLELANLKLFDLDVERRTLCVRMGKGRKDRLLPIGERAVAWVQKYLDASRPRLAIAPDDGLLFLGKFGTGLTSRPMTHLVRRYVEAAGLGKVGSCHLFRHTMATLMLENGADIRFIQQMLGHASLNATQIYTRVSIKKLQEIHTATHPAARLKSRPKGHSDDGEAGPEPTEQDLLAGLDNEQTEEFMQDAAGDGGDKGTLGL